MIVLALLILLVIVCGYVWFAVWFARRIKATKPEIRPTVPEPTQ